LGIWLSGPEMIKPNCFLVREGVWVLKNDRSKKVFHSEDRYRSLIVPAKTMMSAA
jgi:hypothetical protein